MIRIVLARLVALLLRLLGLRSRAPRTIPLAPGRPRRSARPLAGRFGHVGGNFANRAAVLAGWGNCLARQRRAYVRARRAKSARLTSVAEQLSLEAEAAKLLTARRVR